MWDGQSFRDDVEPAERVVFLGDPNGRPATAKKRNSRSLQKNRETMKSISLPIINDNDNQSILKDSIASNEQFEAVKNYKKFQAIVNEKRRVLVDNRDRSISANKPSTMFDSWSATERNNVITKEKQAMEKIWKDSATEYLSLKSNYDSEKANRTGTKSNVDD
jgi:hypothetical protein